MNEIMKLSTAFKKEQNLITSATTIVSMDSTQLASTFEYLHKNEIVMDSILQSSVHEDGSSFKKE